MKFTKAAIRTTKEAPSDADSINAKLLTQGNFMKKELAGVYSLLPLGKRVVRKIEQIIREEMNAIDSVEIGMTAITPLENWEKTGRDKLDIAYRPTDRTILGFSHEEMVTPIAKEYIKSWKDLPMSLYQIQTKFRNEPRAKSGILRGREFLMKDAYSFHRAQEDLDQYYQKMYDAYLKVFARCGLTAYAIEASGGIFTKKVSHEFVTITPAGEDTVIFEEEKGKLLHPQNSEIAVGNAPEPKELLEKWKEKELPLEEKEIPRPKSISKTAEQYKIHEWEILKTLILLIRKKGEKESEMVGVSVRGDLEINMHKVSSYFQTEEFRPATSEELAAKGLAEGFISPIKNSKIKFYADHSVKKMRDFCTGANTMNHDYFNANVERDCNFEDFADFALVKEGFTSVKSGHVLKAEKCVEVGNIFDLETKYSDAFDFKFTDKDGKLKQVLMGCYGIGVTRLMGTAVEAFHDEKGILWPKSIAPYHVIIVPIGKTGEFETSLKKAEDLEKALEKKGIEVLVDDREESPGKKFADADLIGIPLRIVISPRTLEKNSVEWKERSSEKTEEVGIDEVEKKILKWIKM
ncbi:proline--tRNA ligase [Candidatus Peregrinibacteria bacterium]|nr:proline--tRNA ligase [Candidatus Peregrinibacteria bacterium]